MTSSDVNTRFVERKTRLAPSPTGALHLGNARTFLVNWAIARNNGWKILLKIDDLDGPRVKPGAASKAIADLKWLGLDWDEGPVLQSSLKESYLDAINQLGNQGLVYRCACTRSEIQAASVSAPHGNRSELRYPGTCRPPSQVPVQLTQLKESEFGWRIRVPQQTTTWRDEFLGTQSESIQQTVGDFLIATKQGFASYQLSVVIDDQRFGITDVVRGNDLLSSTARQVFLYQQLGFTSHPRYWHLPLVVGEDGRRLAKRHGDTRIEFYREQGVPPERVIGLIANWCGRQTREALTAYEFRSLYSPRRESEAIIKFSDDDHRWLLGSF